MRAMTTTLTPWRNISNADPIDALEAYAEAHVFELLVVPFGFAKENSEHNNASQQ